MSCIGRASARGPGRPAAHGPCRCHGLRVYPVCVCNTVFTTAAGPGRAWASNHISGPGLGLYFRPVQDTSVGVVIGMPRAGSHYNLGTSRGPDKIGSRAGPGPRAVSCTWLPYTMLKPPLVVNVSRDRKAAPGHEGCATSVVQCCLYQLAPIAPESYRTKTAGRLESVPRN